MAHGCYHQGTLGLVGALIVVVRAPVASAGPLLEQWVDATDGPPPAELAVWAEEERVDAAGRRWVKVLVEDPDALAARGLHVTPAAPPPPVPRGYLDPATGTAHLADLVAEAPRAGLVRLGRSIRGEPIDAAWFGQEPSTGAPAERLLAGHHGDEASAWEVALAVAERLAGGDGADPELTAVLDRSTIWVVPFVNPDGASDGTRTNADGVDLNRNYDWRWSDRELRAGPAPFSEPETRAVRGFGALVRPVQSLSLHSGDTNLGWPWNWTTDAPADAAIFEELATAYAATCTQPGFWITQGSAWYVTHGDTNDWAYGRYGVLDLTLELSSPKTPPVSELPALEDEHVDAILELLSRPPDVSGRVVDAGSGRGLEATVSVEGAADTTGDPATGRFHRMLPEGATGLVVSAPGYLPATLGPEGGEVALERDVFGAGAPDPAVVVAPARVRVPEGAGAEVRLLRAGQDPRVLPVTDGAVEVPALLPGAWTLVGEDGRTWPNALLVADELPSAAVEGPELRVARDHAGPGPRAFALEGEERALVELPVAVGVAGLEVDVSALEAEADVLVVTDGRVLGVPAPWSAADGSDDDADEALVAVGPGACDTLPGHRAGWLVSTAWGTALFARARRRR